MATSVIFVCTLIIAFMLSFNLIMYALTLHSLPETNKYIKKTLYIMIFMMIICMFILHLSIQLESGQNLKFWK